MNHKTGKKMNVGGYVAIAKEAKGIAPKSVDAIDEKIASRIKPKVSPVYYDKGGDVVIDKSIKENPLRNPKEGMAVIAKVDENEPFPMVYYVLSIKKNDSGSIESLRVGFKDESYTFSTTLDSFNSTYIPATKKQVNFDNKSGVSLISFKKGGNVETYRDKYNKKYGYKKGTSHDLKEIAKDTGVSLKGIQQIYNKGIGAYKTNPQSVRPNVKSKEQWAYARVYSSVMGGKAAEVDKKELKMKKGGKLTKRFIVYVGDAYDGEVLGSSDTFRGASMISKRLEKKGAFENADSWGIADTQDYFFQRKDNKFAKGGEILKEISTHKAVRNGDMIDIYELDEKVNSIPYENIDDLLPMFDRFEEDNRINRAEFRGMYAKGGIIDEELTRATAKNIYERSGKDIMVLRRTFLQLANTDEKNGDKELAKLRRKIVSEYESKEPKIMEKGGEIEYENEENEAVGVFLLSTKDGKSILDSVKNSDELEAEVVKYHKSKGIPNWDFEDDEDGGIDWVTFSDLYNSLKGGSTYQGGGEIKVGDVVIPYPHEDEFNVYEIGLNKDGEHAYLAERKKDGKTYSFIQNSKDKIVSKSDSTYAKGGEIGNPKFDYGEKVYSYQNEDFPAEISHIRKGEYGYAYKLSLPTDDNGKITETGKYKKSSNWIDEKSLSKTKGGSTYAKGGEIEQQAIYEWNTMDRFVRADFLDEIDEDLDLGESRFQMKAYKYDDLPKNVQQEVVKRLGYDSSGSTYAEGGEIEYEVSLQNPESGDIEKVNVLSDSKSSAEDNAINESGLQGWEIYGVKKLSKGGSTYAKGGKVKVKTKGWFSGFLSFLNY